MSARTDVKQVQIRGVVISSDAKAGTVTLKTEISGYTSAVAMPYTLKQPKVAAKLHAGDTITAMLTAMLTASPTADVLGDVEVVEQAKPEQKAR